ncbi:AfsA-related hotdog domain-containing protein [Streptomyces sp. CA-252508]|uniref:AfsA-related hotdog domain-containing protein n=1 Tax=Streptomyces sp. CA-252508 TaxID=3418946 RepID=UPI003D8F7CB3
MFDHPVDHVPGMVLLEAARQATAAVLGDGDMLPIAITSQFTRYAELDEPCSVEASPLPGAGADRMAVLVTGHQGASRSSPRR